MGLQISKKLLGTRGFLLLVFLIVTSFSVAQSKQFQHITSADGISQSEIYTFLEDSQGFMWFGTVDGLNRYDGYHVSTFNTDKDSPNSITNNTIRCIVEDQLRRIWIGTDDGLCVYDAKFEKIHQIRLKGFEESHLSINAALILNEQLYIGTSQGLLAINVSGSPIDEIGHSVHQIRRGIDTTPYQVVACKLGKEDNIWVMTSTDLYRLNYKGDHTTSTLDQVLVLGDILPDIRNLEEDTNGNLWIVSHDSGFVRYHPSSRRLKHFNSTSLGTNTLSNKISSVTVDKEDNLWIGTHDKGLLFLEKNYLNDDLPIFQSIEHDPYNDRSLSSNLIYSLFVSKSNLLWIGTIGSGINIYDPDRKPFQYYNLHNARQSSYSTNFIRAVYADKEDNIWIGTHNNGLFYYNRSKLKKVDKIGFGTESVFHINDAGDGNTLVCTEQGISLVKRTNGILKTLSQLAIGPAFYTTPVEDDIFWVASLNGLKGCRLTKGEIVMEQEYTTASRPALSFNNCRVIAYSKASNDLYVGTEGGGLNVLHLNEEKVPTSNTIYTKHDTAYSLSNNYIRSIIEGVDSNIWVGTYEGLNKMYKDPGSGKILFKSYTKRDGLSNNTIQSIVEDDQSNLWIGTNQGLCKFNPVTETFVQFTINDGIQSNEFSEHAVFRKLDNEIIIGGINGINTFYPEQIATSDFEPNTTLTDFYLFNKIIHVDETMAEGEKSPLTQSISLTDSIFLAPNQNSIGFDFSAMTFNSPEKVRYAYVLEGFDREWNYTDAHNRKANYTNLSSGDYTFKVKATNNDGVWEETPKSLFISIKTPWYRTTLAFILYGLLTIAALIFFTNYSVLRYTTKEKMLLENKHNKKLRELDELRNRLFVNVSHDLRTPLTLISSPLEVILKNGGLQTESKNLLHLVQRNVKKLRDMTEQLLDITKVEAGTLSPKLQNIELVSFVRNEVLLFENAFDQKGVDLHVNSDEDHYTVSFDPDMMSKVIINILSNALKYTQTGSVTTHISKVAGQSVQIQDGERYDCYIKIQIADTGAGIDETDLIKIFDRFYQGKEENKKGYGIGLSHTKDLIDAHNGHIDVVSKKGEGTTFNIYIPDIQKELAIGEEQMPVLPNKHVASQQNEIPPVEEHSRIVVSSKSSKVLLVEDNLDLRNFIGEELRKHYEVLEATDGDEGLNIAGEHFPDLIVSDVMMPHKDGMEFCKEIKSNIKTSHIPVILLTAKVDKESKYKGLEIGADDYISKPFEMEYLLVRIRNLLENRERLRGLFQLRPNFEPSKVTVTSIDEQFLTGLMSEIEKGIPDAEFTISALEHNLGMSHSSFYNKIKSLTGQSAKELVFAARMKRAKQILEETSNIRVSEVAYMVGFTDPKYFSKRFREYHGSSPSEFVNKNLH